MEAGVTDFLWSMEDIVMMSETMGQRHYLADALDPSPLLERGSGHAEIP